MIVYVVLESCAKDPYNIVDVFYSLEDAREYIETRIAVDRDNWCDYIIESYEVH